MGATSDLHEGHLEPADVSFVSEQRGGGLRQTSGLPAIRCMEILSDPSHIIICYGKRRCNNPGWATMDSFCNDRSTRGRRVTGRSKSIQTRTTSEHMHLHWSRKGVGSRRSELRNAPASVHGPRTCRGTVRFLKFLHALLGETELGLLTLLVIAQELLRWRPAPCSCLSVLCRPACRLSRSRSGQEQSIEPGLRAESDRA